MTVHPIKPIKPYGWDPIILYTLRKQVISLNTFLM